MRTSLANLVKELDISRSLFIGITGLPGCGKTTLSNKLMAFLTKRYKDYQVIHIDGDLYLKDSREKKMQKISRMLSYKDYWEVFQIKWLEEDIKKIKLKTPFERKGLYSRKTGRLDANLQIDFLKGKIIFIINGMQIIHPKLLPRFDKIIFLDTDPELCLKRKTARATYRIPEETTSLFKNFEEPLFNTYRQALLKKRNVIHLS